MTAKPTTHVPPTSPALSPIARLNDDFRRTSTGGRIAITNGVLALGPVALAEILQTVQHFSTFDIDNDPYHEHDFGAFGWGEQRLYWKIDYYDPEMTAGSPDPADPNLTARVLTIMLAGEY